MENRILGSRNDSGRSHEPPHSNAHGGGREHPEQVPVVGPIASQTPGAPCNERGERHHAKNRPGGEGQQIGDRGRGGGQCQGRKDPEEMGAAGKAMESSYAEGGVRMPLPLRIMIPMGVGVDMEMGMGLAVVRMVMGVDVQPCGLTETPDTDSDQHRAHQTFAPIRDGLHGQGLPESESRQPDKRDPRGMPQTPPQPKPPRLAMGTRHQRRHCRQMVRSGPDVEEPRAKAEDRNQHTIEDEGWTHPGQSPASPTEDQPTHPKSRIPTQQDPDHLRMAVQEVTGHPHRSCIPISNLPDAPLTEFVDHGVGIGEEDRGVGGDDELRTPENQTMQERQDRELPLRR